MFCKLKTEGKNENDEGKGKNEEIMVHKRKNLIITEKFKKWYDFFSKVFYLT